MTMGVVICDGFGAIAYVNDAGRRMLGSRAAGSLQGLFDPKGAEEEAIRRLLEVGDAVADHLVHWTDDQGQGADLRVNCAPIRDGFGGLVGAVTTLHRLTPGHRRVHHRLRESEDRFRALVLASSDVLYRMSADWSEMRQLLSDGFLASTEVPRRTWLDTYIHPDDREAVRSVIDEAIATRGVFQLEHRVIRADGTLGWTYSRAVPIVDADGDIVEWFGTASDTTPRHRQEDALLEGARQKDEFIATLAHELRNPLSAIRSSVELLERLAPSTGPDTEHGRALAVLSRQTSHLSRLVHDLLDVSLVAQDRLVLRTERIAIGQVIARSVEISAAQLAASGHTWRVLGTGSPVWLDGDPVRLTQVFANLLDNAGKYSPPGTDISLVVATERGEAVVRVRDQGVGIARAFLPHAFETFAQDVNTGAGVRQGMGLGLALVRRLVELHGGTVEIRSEGAGMGTEAIVRLPVAVDVGADGAEGDAMSDAGGTGATAHRVLLVDDNKDAVEVLGLLLGTVGVQTSVAYDGASALEAMSAFGPTAALIDIGMAPMDGFQLAGAIRKRREFADVVLVALTGWGTEEDRRKTHAAGFDHHLTKPVDVSEVQAVLASAHAPSRHRRSGRNRPHLPAGAGAAPRRAPRSASTQP